MHARAEAAVGSSAREPKKTYFDTPPGSLENTRNEPIAYVYFYPEFPLEGSEKWFTAKGYSDIPNKKIWISVYGGAKGLAEEEKHVEPEYHFRHELTHLDHARPHTRCKIEEFGLTPMLDEGRV